MQTSAPPTSQPTHHLTRSSTQSRTTQPNHVHKSKHQVQKHSTHHQGPNPSKPSGRRTQRTQPSRPYTQRSKSPHQQVPLNRPKVTNPTNLNQSRTPNPTRNEDNTRERPTHRPLHKSKGRVPIITHHHDHVKATHQINRRRQTYNKQPKSHHLQVPLNRRHQQQSTVKDQCINVLPYLGT